MRVLPTALFPLIIGSVFADAPAVTQTPKKFVPPPIIGRWDITVHGPNGDYPDWLEVTLSGRQTLVGRFVAAFGSSRPIGQVFYSNGRFHFSLPVQFEDLKNDMRFTGRMVGDRLEGDTVTFYGKRAHWTGVRAPKLRRASEPEWGEPVELFNGTDLSGWQPRNPSGENNWSVKNGILTNVKSGTDLVTTRKFTDFKIHAEFRYPKGSNSGIYLRGRYEAQIEDNYGMEPDSHNLGGIYGFLTPRINAAKQAGEWQTYDITLVGREVTVVLNGEMVICQREISGITGGALDSNEGEPGPIYFQGDHGPVEFRKVTITPAKKF
jgi:hypothetical protein